MGKKLAIRQMFRQFPKILYGQAIRGYIGNKEGIKNAILAIFDHCVAHNTKSLDQQHSDVPKMDGVFTGDWVDRSSYNAKKRLPTVFCSELDPIFKDLSADCLLNRCLQGDRMNQ